MEILEEVALDKALTVPENNPDEKTPEEDL